MPAIKTITKMLKAAHASLDMRPEERAEVESTCAVFREGFGSDPKMSDEARLHLEESCQRYLDTWVRPIIENVIDHLEKGDPFYMTAADYKVGLFDRRRKEK